MFSCLLHFNHIYQAITFLFFHLLKKIFSVIFFLHFLNSRLMVFPKKKMTIKKILQFYRIKRFFFWDQFSIVEMRKSFEFDENELKKCKWCIHFWHSNNSSFEWLLEIFSTLRKTQIDVECVFWFSLLLFHCILYALQNGK